MPKQPELVWLDNLTPKSTRFDDTYYSRADGLEETRYVFLDGNGLPDRWRAGDNPVIGELGFGTGLNFLATWLAYGAAVNGLDGSARSAQQSLTFVSVEKYPMDRMSLLTALSPWEILHPLANQLAAAWQPEQAGWQALSFDGVRLLLYIGDAVDALATMPVTVDAWYLDGFNPKTNPDLWSGALMQAVFDASTDHATLASYTAAGWVRRNLQAAGFSIAKRKGFGHKRDMITGCKPPSSLSSHSEK
ncbi:tRNA (5-methylaminomethyl-2-thiouridine)(34)-methyltransferase MnmD [Cohaesibacter intestini]|uniref:tRNA (5-methylaminomethyl-2-thiouridine)(34)-methyltransferase MnmD n=1 Tax=Cohaesibacter intestini TaxID=2211145 RepID=UPI000DEBA640|nr:tRNA (5-methylaminomethyl-2-thiouridine)(34)-methyltransferase MnmD [Cohaesibacter intestini]